MNNTEKLTRSLVGTVVSNKMDKSVVVSVERQVKHKLYKKFIKLTTKICAHDSSNACQIGDLVKIQECRPISKRKKWRLKEIIKKAV